MVKKDKSNKKCQAVSTDILVVVVVILFGALFLVANKVNNTSDTDFDVLYKDAADQSNVIVNDLKGKQVFDSENNVNVENLLQVDIDTLKQELNIKNDFCIVFEKDGDLVMIDSESGVHGIGSSNIIVNDVPCISS